MGLCQLISIPKIKNIFSDWMIKCENVNFLCENMKKRIFVFNGDSSTKVKSQISVSKI